MAKTFSKPFLYCMLHLIYLEYVLVCLDLLSLLAISRAVYLSRLLNYRFLLIVPQI